MNERPEVVAPRVLIVEDEPVDVVAVRRGLQSVGFTGSVLDVHSVDEALARITGAEPPDFVLLDLDMPGRSGLDLLRELRAVEGRPVPPAVVLTSSASDDDCRACYAAGAAGYFVKPVTWDEMQAMLEVVVAYWTKAHRPRSA